MKHLFINIAILIVTAQQALLANTLKVGIGQPYNTIQSAINAAATGDTVKVLPGTYNEAIIINKNIVIQGSGYETTRITSANNPTVTMSSGKLMWFSITSISGDGIQATAGLITNDVIAGCGRYGVNFLQNSTASIKNSLGELDEAGYQQRDGELGYCHLQRPFSGNTCDRAGSWLPGPCRLVARPKKMILYVIA